jgi:hypothetical protein
VPLLITECGLQAATLPEVLNIATTGYVPEDIEIHQQNQSDDVCYEDEDLERSLAPGPTSSIQLYITE